GDPVVDFVRSRGRGQKAYNEAETFFPPESPMPDTTEGFHTIDECLAELRAGRMIVLVDDEHRENEGDLVIAAEKVTPEAITFMVRNGCGILGLALSAAICERLGLEPLSGRNVDP